MQDLLEIEAPDQAPKFAEYSKQAKDLGFSDDEIIDEFVNRSEAPKKRVQRTNAQRLAGYATSALTAIPSQILGLLETVGPYLAGGDGTNPPVRVPEGAEPADVDTPLRQFVAEKLGTDVQHLRPQSRLGKNIDRSIEFAVPSLAMLGGMGALPTTLRGAARLGAEEIVRGFVDREMEEAEFGGGSRLLAQLGLTGAANSKGAARALGDLYGRGRAKYARWRGAKAAPHADPQAAQLLEKHNIKRYPASAVTGHGDIVQRQEKAIKESVTSRAGNVMQDFQKDLAKRFDEYLKDISPVASDSPAFADNRANIAKSAEELRKTNRADMTNRRAALVEKMQSKERLHEPNLHDAALNQSMRAYHEKYKLVDRESGHLPSSVDEVRRHMFEAPNPELEIAKGEAYKARVARAEQKALSEKPVDNPVYEIKEGLGPRVAKQDLANSVQDELRVLRRDSWTRLQELYDGQNFELKQLGKVDASPWVDKAKAYARDLRKAQVLTRDQQKAIGTLQKAWRGMRVVDDMGKTLGYRVGLDSFNQTLKNLGKTIDFETLESGKTQLTGLFAAGHDFLEGHLKKHPKLARKLAGAKAAALEHFETFRNRDHVRRFLNAQDAEKSLNATLQRGQHFDDTLNALRNSEKFGELKGQLHRAIVDNKLPSDSASLANRGELSKLQSRVSLLLDSDEMFRKLPIESKRAMRDVVQIAKEEPAPATAKLSSEIPKTIDKGFATEAELMTGYETLLVKEEALTKLSFQGAHDPRADFKKIYAAFERVAEERYGKEIAGQMRGMRAEFVDQAAAQNIMAFAKDGDLKPLLRQIGDYDGLQAVKKVFDKLPNGEHQLAVLRRAKFEEYLQLQVGRTELSWEHVSKLQKLTSKDQRYWRALIGDKNYENLRGLRSIFSTFVNNTRPYMNVSMSGHTANRSIKDLAALNQIMSGKFLRYAAVKGYDKLFSAVVTDPEFVEAMVGVNKSKTARQLDSNLKKLQEIYDKLQLPSLRALQTQSKEKETADD